MSVNQNTELPSCPQGRWRPFLNSNPFQRADFSIMPQQNAPRATSVYSSPNNRTPEWLHRVILDSKLVLLIERQRGKNLSSTKTALRCSVTFYVRDHTLEVGVSSGKKSYATSLLWYVSYLLLLSFFFLKKKLSAS